MPAAPQDILTRDRARAALRIDGTAGDDDLDASIAAAVDYCERLAAKPLLDRTETMQVRRPSLSNSPLLLPSIYVKSVTAIRYWETDQELRDEPAGTVMTGRSDPPDDADDPIGRLEAPVDRHYTAVWPPATGWPEVLTDSWFLVTYVEGWPDAAGDPDADGYDVAADIPGIAGIRKAVTLMAGVYYDGITEDTHRRAVADLLQPFRDARFLV